jgi:hypothetical protein
MAAALSRASAAPRWIDGYLAGLGLTLPFMPTVAAVVSVVAYLLLPDKVPSKQEAAAAASMLDGVPADPITAVAAGLVAAGVAWLVLGVLARPLTSAEASQPRIYSELSDRLKLLSDRLPPTASLPPGAPLTAHKEMEDLLASVSLELSSPRSDPALRWVIGYGYTNLLRELHRASEVLILLEPREAVIGDAIEDERSLADSTIDGRDRLRAMLRAAVSQLSPGAAEAFLPAAAGTAARPNLTDMEAREATREVHHAIKRFRDDRRDGLVGARYNLIWAMLAVALPAYLLLGLAMIVGVPRIQVVTASTFFLVGAIVGLFQRLDSQAKRNTAVEDFGLFQARLISAPLHSGVAAVAGVALVTIVTAVAAGTATEEVNGVPKLAADLAAAFDLTSQPIGLLYAAVFGLTPALLTSNLEKQGNKLLEDLSTTAPATAGGT